MILRSYIHRYIILLRAHCTDEEMLAELRVESSSLSCNVASLISCGYADMFSSVSFATFYMRAIGTELSRLGVTYQKVPIPSIVGDEDSSDSSAFDKSRVVLLNIPWNDVFAAVARHRIGLIPWLERLDSVSVIDANGSTLRSNALDVVLSQVLRVTMRRPKCDLYRWNSQRGTAGRHSCVRWLESPHPYPNSTEVITKVSFPGTSSQYKVYPPRLTCSIFSMPSTALLLLLLLLLL